MYAVDQIVADPELMDGLERSLREDAPAPALREVKIKLTSKCNLRCQMCHYWETTREDSLSTERWQAIFAELRELGCRKVHFSGGEVFLRRDFLDLVESVIGLGIKANMTTNATLVDRERARRLARAGVNSISVSLDGPTSKVHDRIRGVPGAFRRSLRTIRWVQRYADGKKPPKLRINFVVMNDNFRTLPEMVRLAGELGAIDLNPMPVDEKGERKRRLSRGQIEEYNRELAPQVAELRQRYGMTPDPARIHPFGTTPREIGLSRDGFYARGFFERRPCLAPWLSSFIAWNGDVYLCCMTNGRMDALGNAGTQSMLEIFQGEPYRRVRRSFLAGQHLKPCHRCDLFLVENARLHAALGEDGAFREPPPAPSLPA